MAGRDDASAPRMRWLALAGVVLCAACASAPRPAVRPAFVLQPPPLPMEISSLPTATPVEISPAALAASRARAGAIRGDFDDEALAEEDEDSDLYGRVEPVSARGRLIAGRASSLVGVRSLRKISTRVPDDCTGVPRLAYGKAGIDLFKDLESRPNENGVTAIFRRARAAKALHKHTPRPGDLVFFRETYDRNRDGRRNDGLTHVAVVESVAPDGTVTFVHRSSRGVSRGKLNLSHPRQHTYGDEVVNDWLRPASKRTRAYLTGELFSFYASPDRL